MAISPVTPVTNGAIVAAANPLPVYIVGGPGGSMLVTPLTAVNFNDDNSDNAITITLPTGFTRYLVQALRISDASADITTATAGLFTAAAAGGTAIVTGGSAITVSTAAENTNNNSMSFTIANADTQSYDDLTLFFRVATAQGSAATATVSLFIIPLP